MIPFEFICVEDTGPQSGACCPHCGSAGRYIYHFKINGVAHAAMAGCYKMLTGKLEKGDTIRFYELLADKQAKNKPLNGWDKNVLRLQGYLQERKYSEDWVNQKINEVLSHRKSFLAKVNR